MIEVITHPSYLAGAKVEHRTLRDHGITLTLIPPGAYARSLTQRDDKVEVALLNDGAGHG